MASRSKNVAVAACHYEGGTKGTVSSRKARQKEKESVLILSYRSGATRCETEAKKLITSLWSL